MIQTNTRQGICLFGLIVCVLTACNTKEQINAISTDDYFRDVSIPLQDFIGEFSSTQLLVEGGIEYLILFSINAHAFQIVNLESLDIENTVFLSSEGKNFIPRNSVERFFFTSMESAFIESSDYYFQIKLSKGKYDVEQRLNLKGITNSVVKNFDYVNHQFLGFNGYFFIDGTTRQIPVVQDRFCIVQFYPNGPVNFDFFQSNILGYIDLMDSTFIDLEIGFPETLKTNWQDYPNMFTPQVTARGDSLMINFPLSDYIYIYNFASGEISSVQVRSDYAPSISEGVESPNLPLGKRYEYSAKNSQYFDILWDKQRRLYYRIAKSKTEMVEVDLYTRRFGNHYLSILNEDFELIREIKLPQDYEAYFHISKRGLLFFSRNEIDELLLPLGLLDIDSLLDNIN